MVLFKFKHIEFIHEDNIPKDLALQQENLRHPCIGTTDG